MDFKNYYQVLGLERGATQDEVKRAYRKLARTYHPNINKEPGAEAKFKEIGEAHEVLGDAEKRAAYDQVGRSKARTSGRRRTGAPVSSSPVVRARRSVEAVLSCAVAAKSSVWQGGCK